MVSDSESIDDPTDNKLQSGNVDRKIDDLIVEFPQKDGSIFFKCNLCEIFYPSKSYLKKHVKNHFRTEAFSCDVDKCSKSFARKSTLADHKKRVHDKILSFKCPVCGKGFFGKKDKQQHILIHDEARQNRERILPKTMLHLLNEVDKFNFDGREIFSDTVCDLCGKIFEKKNEVKRHKNGSVHNQRASIFTCKMPGCTVSYSDQSSLYNHMMHHNNKKEVKIESVYVKEGEANVSKDSKTSDGFRWGNIIATPVEIEVSSVVDDRQKNLKVNKSEKHDKNKEEIGANIFSFQCRYCPIKFDSVAEMKKHCMLHVYIQNKDESDESVTMTENINYSKIDPEDRGILCHLCNKYLSTKEALEIHKLVHVERFTYSCDYSKCSLEFQSKKSLNTHQEEYHKADTTPDVSKLHPCLDCGKTFDRKNQLERHKQKHSDEKSFMCTDCGKGFKTKKSLDYHMKLHAGLADLKCDKCDANYVSPPALLLHKKNKHPDPNTERFKCKFCDEEFSYKFRLSTHLTKHTGEKRFKCKECGKAFRLYNGYKSHLNMHSGIKDFKCSFCEKQFTQKQHLVVHERRHTGDKRHKCDICERAFVEPATLRHHLKTHKTSQ